MVIEVKYPVLENIRFLTVNDRLKQTYKFIIFCTCIVQSSLLKSTNCAKLCYEKISFSHYL